MHLCMLTVETIEEDMTENGAEADPIGYCKMLHHMYSCMYSNTVTTGASRKRYFTRSTGTAPPFAKKTMQRS